MKLGIEKKEERWKLYVFGVLALIGGWVAYSNLTPDSGSSSSSSVYKVAPPVPLAVPETSSPTTTRRRPNGRVAGDFRPSLKKERAEDRPDLTKIDPTIKLGLLTRVQNISLEGGVRNIFQFGIATDLAPAAATIPKVKPIIPGSQVANNQPPPHAGPPPPPQAPPIPFKYYGYSNVKGETRKRAFFLDGDDIIVAWEGDMIKNRYKVVHIGNRNVEMEDTQFKNARQTLPLVEENAG
jgi:hypothetical protein